MIIRGDLRRTLQLLALICAIADIALVGIYLSPLLPSRAAAQSEIQETRRQAQLLDDRVKKLAAIQTHLKTSQRETTELFATSLPAERNVYSVVLGEVSRLAERSRVNATGVSFEPDRKSEQGLRRIEVSAKLQGEYASLIEFLNAIERSHVFFIIDEVALSSGQGRAGVPDNTLSLQIKFETYAQAPQTASS